MVPTKLPVVAFSAGISGGKSGFQAVAGMSATVFLLDGSDYGYQSSAYLDSFLALFPMAFYWLRRAYRIVFRRDYSEVALKGGMPPANPQKFAPDTVATNLIAGVLPLA